MNLTTSIISKQQSCKNNGWPIETCKDITACVDNYPKYLQTQSKDLLVIDKFEKDSGLKYKAYCVGVNKVIADLSTVFTIGFVNSF